MYLTNICYLDGNFNWKLILSWLSSVIPGKCCHSRSAIFWYFTQHTKVISYRRCGTTYRPHIKSQAVQEKRRWQTIKLHCFKL